MAREEDVLTLCKWLENEEEDVLMLLTLWKWLEKEGVEKKEEDFLML